MFSYVAKKIFGTKNARVIKSMRPIVARIGDLESGLQTKSDAELQATTPELKRRLEKGESLDSILPEAFAVCREAGAACWACGTSTCSSSACHGAGRGRHRRDGDRRRQDAGRDAAGLSQRPDGRRHPRHHRQRLPGAPRLRMDVADLQRTWPVGRLLRSERDSPQRRAAALPIATSPTAPTASSASITCATT